FDDDWSRSAVLAIAGERPARFVEAVLAASSDGAAAQATPEQTRLLRALAARVAANGDLGQAVELVTSLGERGVRAPEIAVPLLEELAHARAEPGSRPWPSPRLDQALIRLLKSPRVEVAIAALPLSVRWSTSRTVVEERTALGKRLAEVVHDE